MSGPIGTTAYFKGYVADVFKTDLKLYGQPFAWTVKATMEVSEWPELQASVAAVRLRREARRREGATTGSEPVAEAPDGASEPEG